MIPIEVERHGHSVTVTTDTKKRMYAIVHLSVPAGFDPSDFSLSRVGTYKWELAFEEITTAHRFKRLLDEAGRLVAQSAPNGAEDDELAKSGRNSDN